MKKAKLFPLLLLGTVFFFSTSILFREYIQTQESQEVYQNSAELASMVPSEPVKTEGQNHSKKETKKFLDSLAQEKKVTISDSRAKQLYGIDIFALQEVNPDVLGWIYIPGTNISYPLLQGEDNQYYLNYTWDKQAYFVGSIFLECKNSADFSDYNTILYGHNLNNGTMFSQLHLYKDQEQWVQYPYVYIVTASGAYRYHIFAAYEVPTTAITYQLSFEEDGQKQRFLDECISWSVLDTGIIPTENDRILTLSTCTGVIRTNRWVVQAKLDGLLSQPEIVDLSEPAGYSDPLYLQ